jgi:long-chain acyl-CoA synthetase
MRRKPAAHTGVRACLEGREVAALGEVAPWEPVRKVVVLTQPLTVAADELTVSLKLRRQVIVARYGDRLEGLYRE